MKIAFFSYNMDVGGVETFLINVLKKIDTSKYHIDFFCYKNLSKDKRSLIKKYNSNIELIANPETSGLFKYLKELYRVIKNGKYDVVYSNTYTNSAYIMLVAFLCKVKKRITHSHTTKSLKTKNVLKFIKWNLSRCLINIFSTKKIACGEEAGRMLYNHDNFLVVENGIFVEKFKYNEPLRNELRKKYNVDNKTVLIGHVGRFTDEKNHIFLVNVFETILKLNLNFKLLLVGDGSNYEYIQKYVKNKKIDNAVIFTGSVNNPEIYYNMMDIFCLPSKYEGFPLTVIEAQTNGLPIICSDNVPKEVALSENSLFLPLDEDYWVDELIKPKKRINIYKNIEKSKFNVENTVKTIESIFEE